MSETKQNWEDNAKNWKERYPSAMSQLEFFCLKNGDVPRADVVTLLEQFNKFDSSKRGELEDSEALKLLELRGAAKSLGELRAMVAEIDRDKNKKLSFLEWGCAIFNKKWSSLFEINADPAEVEKYESFRIEAEKNLNAWTETAAARASDEKNAKELAEKLAHDTEMAKQKLANIEAEQKKLHDEQEDEKKRDEEEKAAKKAQAGAKGRAAAFEIAASVSTTVTDKEKERIKQEGHLKTEKKKAEKDLVDVSAKAAQAATDAQASEQSRLQADDEVRKYTDEVKAYSTQEQICRRARDEKEKYEDSRTRAESEAKAKAEAKAKSDADAKARLAAKASLFSKT